jgi:hypothetical protein
MTPDLKGVSTVAGSRTRGHLGRALVALGLLLALLGALSLLWPTVRSAVASIDLPPPTLTPWEGVGGCGAGGSGGGGGGIKWVGTGVSGGLVDVEVGYSASIGQNFNSKTVKARLSGKPRWNMGLGLTVPVVSKSGSMQPSTAMDEKTGINTGGLGDLSLDYSVTIGSQGQNSISLALGMPTGQWDIKRGKDNSKMYLPSSLQKGSGLWTPTLGLSHSKDVEDGIMLFDISYSHPMAINFYGKNQLVNDKPDQYNEVYQNWDNLSSEEKDRFEYYFKPYGENDLGAYSPPSLSASYYYGYRGKRGFVHSWGATFAVPLGVAWIPSFNATKYDPHPDPDHQAWSSTLNYGLEFSRSKFPIFVGVSLPLHDRKNSADPSDPYNEDPFRKWDWPDWNDFLQQWTVGIGIKSTMF